MEKEKKKIPKKGTIAEREAFTAARREEWRERDAARLRLGQELAARATLHIPRERGLVVLPPGALEGADEVAASANEVIDSIGHERLVTEFNPSKDTMAREFLPPSAQQLDSPYLRFALNEAILAPVSEYLGLVPILHMFDVWYSPPATRDRDPRRAQQWHLDGDDTTQVKVWVHCDDIGPDSGPLTALDATVSATLAQHIRYDSSVEYRIPDEKVAAHTGPSDLVPLAGPRGAVDLIDTSRCFHFGSRVARDAPARRVFYAQYVTPYAFKFKHDHRAEAPFRHLATADSTELERLVLGVD